MPGESPATDRITGIETYKDLLIPISSVRSGHIRGSSNGRTAAFEAESRVRVLSPSQTKIALQKRFLFVRTQQGEALLPFQQVFFRCPRVGDRAYPAFASFTRKRHAALVSEHHLVMSMRAKAGSGRAGQGRSRSRRTGSIHQ